MTLEVSGIEPEAQARPRFVGTNTATGRPVTYSPKTDFYYSVLRCGKLRRPKFPADGPLALSAVFRFRRHGSVKNHQIAKWTKPDGDNILKALMDALTAAGWWVDDGRVCSISVSKVYAGAGEAPGVSVRVWRVTDPAWSEP